MPADASEAREYGEALARLGEQRFESRFLKPASELVANTFAAIATSRYMQPGGFEAGQTPRKPSDTGPLRIASGRLARAVRGDLQGRGDFVREFQIQAGGFLFKQVLKVPYAAIHEYGGKIPATEKMEAYFWAQWYDAPEGQKERWKALALGARGNSYFRIKARPYAEPAIQDVPEATADQMATLLVELLDRL